MIGEFHGKYYIECDYCGMYYDKFATFDDAVEFAQNENWEIERENGEWFHYCAECSEDE